jgi:hypothetical protein
MVEHYETTTINAFVRYLATHCLPHGYRYYVSGLLPQGKDYRAIDDRIIAKYGIAKNRWERCRRKRAGEDNLRYLRYGRWFLLIATGPRGQDLFFKSEVNIRDVHAVPIRFHGYELTYRGGRVWVRIDREHLCGIRKRLLRMAVWAGASTLFSEFQAIPFEPYRSVRFQLFRLLREVNRRRNAAGLERVPKSAIPDRAQSYRLLEPAEGKSQTMDAGGACA